SKINIKNSAKFNIRSTSRLTYDIISQLHLPQNGDFMEQSNFLVAINKLILRTLTIIHSLLLILGLRLVNFSVLFSSYTFSSSHISSRVVYSDFVV
ncbi:hypothetical protein, partial [Escherichia coli]|uniref:hypothetical protein n=1 Tax=Escherichia coli TaxID=562 RepID=UPI001BAFFADF